MRVRTQPSGSVSGLFDQSFASSFALGMLQAPAARGCFSPVTQVTLAIIQIDNFNVFHKTRMLDMPASAKKEYDFEDLIIDINAALKNAQENSAPSVADFKLFILQLIEMLEKYKDERTNKIANGTTLLHHIEQMLEKPLPKKVDETSLTFIKNIYFPCITLCYQFLLFQLIDVHAFREAVIPKALEHIIIYSPEKKEDYIPKKIAAYLKKIELFIAERTEFLSENIAISPREPSQERATANSDQTHEPTKEIEIDDREKMTADFFIERILLGFDMQIYARVGRKKVTGDLNLSTLSADQKKLLSQANLAGFIFMGNVNARNCNLSGTNFSNCEFQKDFIIHNANMTDVNFSGAKLLGDIHTNTKTKVGKKEVFNGVKQITKITREFSTPNSEKTFIVDTVILPNTGVTRSAENTLIVAADKAKEQWAAISLAFNEQNKSWRNPGQFFGDLWNDNIIVRLNKMRIDGNKKPLSDFVKINFFLDHVQKFPNGRAAKALRTIMPKIDMDKAAADFHAKLNGEKSNVTPTPESPSNNSLTNPVAVRRFDMTTDNLQSATDEEKKVESALASEQKAREESALASEKQAEEAKAAEEADRIIAEKVKSADAFILAARDESTLLAHNNIPLSSENRPAYTALCEFNRNHGIKLLEAPAPLRDCSRFAIIGSNEAITMTRAVLDVFSAEKTLAERNTALKMLSENIGKSFYAINEFKSDGKLKKIFEAAKEDKLTTTVFETLRREAYSIDALVDSINQALLDNFGYIEIKIQRDQTKNEFVVWANSENAKNQKLFTPAADKIKLMRRLLDAVQTPLNRLRDNSETVLAVTNDIKKNLDQIKTEATKDHCKFQAKFGPMIIRKISAIEAAIAAWQSETSKAIALPEVVEAPEAKQMVAA
ncbi:MAG: pentapeptide repeat-containing protein [Gammaproteobacteria bacterium]|nr:pentapeptide repeat-containing protein [Gammaproteobacteria bacterium]